MTVCLSTFKPPFMCSRLSQQQLKSSESTKQSNKMWFSHKGILVSNEKEVNANAWNSMLVFQAHYK